ncbi:hypothetical protein MRX96_020838 [Rhipicephalus microplus]
MASKRKVCQNIPSVKALVAAGERNGMANIATLKETPRNAFKRPAPADPGDVAIVFHSSGSTGLPKAGLISHRNFIAELVTFGYKNEGLRKGDIFLAYLPLMHAAPMWLLFTMLTHHVQVVLVAAKDLAQVLMPIPKYKVTTLVLYPTHGLHIVQRGLPPPSGCNWANCSEVVSSFTVMVSQKFAVPLPTLEDNVMTSRQQESQCRT